MDRFKNEKLTTFTTSSIGEILNDHPEWVGYMRISSNKESEISGSKYVKFVIPGDNKLGSLRELIILTENDEITICFECFHSHFDEWNSASDHYENSAKFFIENLISEKIAIISWWHERQITACSYLNVPYQVLPDSNVIFSNIQIKSWNGNFNEEIDYS